MFRNKSDCFAYRYESYLLWLLILIIYNTLLDYKALSTFNNSKRSFIIYHICKGTLNIILLSQLVNFGLNFVQNISWISETTDHWYIIDWWNFVWKVYFASSCVCTIEFLWSKWLTFHKHFFKCYVYFFNDCIKALLNKRSWNSEAIIPICISKIIFSVAKVFIFLKFIVVVKIGETYCSLIFILEIFYIKIVKLILHFALLKVLELFVEESTILLQKIREKHLKEFNKHIIHCRSTNLTWISDWEYLNIFFSWHVKVYQSEVAHTASKIDCENVAEFVCSVFQYLGILILSQNWWDGVSSSRSWFSDELNTTIIAS